MNIYNKDGYLFYKEHEPFHLASGDRLILESAILNKSIDYINETGVRAISIIPSYYKNRDLDFLRHTSSIERLYLLDEKIDVSKINTLSKLKALHIGKANALLDFNNFPVLETLGVTWSEEIVNIESSTNLRRLLINNYKKSSLEQFGKLSKLEYCYFYKPSFICLKGIENFPNLTDFNLDNAVKLESLEGLNASLQHLKKLYIYSSKFLTNYQPLAKIISLEHLELRKTGETESIDFLKGLSALTKVVLGFKVLGGDMSYLNQIKDVGFIDFPHYSYKNKDFNRGNA